MAKRKTTTSSKTGKKRPPKVVKGPGAVRVPEVLAAEDHDREEIAEQHDTEEEEFTEKDIDAEAESEAESASVQPTVDRAAPDSDSDSPDWSGSADRALVPTSDLLARYMEEVRRHPLLTPEEELELATRLKESGDLNAAKRLVQANLRLVVKIAMEYRNYYSNLLDLIQEGNVGLMKAVSKFDPTKGARLSYYSSWWIRSYILKYLLDNFRLVKIGKTQAQKKLFYHLMREKQRLEAQGLFAGPKLLAEKLNVREKDVIDMEQRLSGRGAEMSLDTPVDKETGATLHLDQLADDHEAQDESLARQQLVHLLKARLPEFEKQLNDKERRILRERLLAEDPKTLQEVADNYGLTRERARQIEVKVISKLRDFLDLDI